MRSVDELIRDNLRADTNLSWESMMTHDLAEEIIEQSLTAQEFQDLVDALDDGVFEIVMSFKK